MSSRWDRTEALVLHVSSKVRLLAVLKLRKPQQTQPRPRTQHLLHAINQHHFLPRVNSEPRRASPSILLSSTQRRTRQTTHAQNPPCLCKQTSGKSVVRPPCRPERTCIPREPLRKGEKYRYSPLPHSLDSHRRLGLSSLVLLRTKSSQPQAAVWHREDPARCARSSFSVQQ